MKPTPTSSLVDSKPSLLGPAALVRPARKFLASDLTPFRRHDPKEGLYKIGHKVPNCFIFAPPRFTANMKPSVHAGLRL